MSACGPWGVGIVEGAPLVHRDGRRGLAGCRRIGLYITFVGSAEPQNRREMDCPIEFIHAGVVYVEELADLALDLSGPLDHGTRALLRLLRPENPEPVTAPAVTISPLDGQMFLHWLAQSGWQQAAVRTNGETAPREALAAALEQAAKGKP